MRSAVCRRFPVMVLLSLLVSGAAAAAGSGDVVPFFKARDLQGQPVSLGDLVGSRRVAVFFWDWRRATSTRAMQALDRLQALYGKQGFAAIAVEGEGSSIEKVLERVEQLRAIGNRQRYTIVPDPGGRIARQFRVDSTPQLFLLDGAGRVSCHFDDFRAEDEAVLEQKVKEALGIAPPPPPAAAVPVRSPAVDPPQPPQPVSQPSEDPARALVEKYRYFGNFHLNRNELALAEEYFRKIVALAPEDTAAWLSIGESCARQRRYDQAREAWEQVLRCDPGNREADANIRRLIRGEY
jgi:tetratricopeptide (TPR) repeat protein